jgi:hypothetical protein
MCVPLRSDPTLAGVTPRLDDREAARGIALDTDAARRAAIARRGRLEVRDHVRVELVWVRGDAG